MIEVVTLFLLASSACALPGVLNSHQGHYNHRSDPEIFENFHPSQYPNIFSQKSSLPEGVESHPVQTPVQSKVSVSHVENHQPHFHSQQQFYPHGTSVSVEHEQSEVYTDQQPFIQEHHVASVSVEDHQPEVYSQQQYNPHVASVSVEHQQPQVYSQQQYNPHVASVSVEHQQPQVYSHQQEHHVVSVKESDEKSAASARIVEQNSDVHPDGSYFNEWKSDNGIQVSEQALLKQVGEATVPVVQGSYAYTDEEGHQYQVHYTADENGFQVHGDHLPTPPPLPAAIARGLEWIRAHPPVEVYNATDNSQYYHQQEVVQPVVVDN